MGKLLFLFIKSVNRKLTNQELNFSEEFDVHFNKENTLVIKEKSNRLKGFWGDGVYNFNLLLGKNGVGKTSILDLLGLNNKTRGLHFNRGKYFKIYQIQDNLFYYSGTMSNQIKNIDENLKKKNNFLFKFEDGFVKETNTRAQNQIHIHYIRNAINFSWSSTKKIFRKNDDTLIRYSYPTSKFKDVLNAYYKFGLFENQNRAIKIEQKITYSNNSRYLSYIYNFNSKDISRDSNNFLFLDDKSNELNNLIYKEYSRINQNSIYENHTNHKSYFILRLLEKILIKQLSTLISLERNKDSKFNVLFNILESKQMNDEIIDNETSIETKINYLIYMMNFMSFSFKEINLPIIEIDNLIELLDKIPDKFFYSYNEIVFPQEGNYHLDEISILIEEYTNYFKTSFVNFSDGELVYLNVFSTIAKAIEDSYAHDTILLLDEPDINLHPEWARRFIHDLIRIIQTKYLSKKVQIIISSHSPFIVTDFPKENIYLIKTNKKSTNEISNPEFGFAANFYDLISDTFFMESPIGEFALQKIQNIKNSKVTNSNQVIDTIDDQLLKRLIIEENINDKN
ncbi:AAA family ATPase [Exiguobacterium sp. SL-9]|uniref:AAA family ATPase n=1 Tax=Exiguobacterium sp. SL-9 TaxID=2510963 RepID=UPI0010388218|nr:AAA family ATPase [Exiguobacterium sp. SL-9]TCI20400.1 hypothetical protein EVJ34_14300 [Exiguobacterium sp. SL-9]